MRSVLTVLFVGASLGLFAQIQSAANKGSKCYERSKPKANQRFVEWECGKVAGVVNCNEKLAYDENTNTITSASNGTPFSGTCETCFSNGLLERRITFVNGKETGLDSTFYRSGCLQVVRNHIGGEENGTWYFYYDSTQQLAWEINYLVGEKHGKSIYFSPDGDTTLWEVYNKGQLNGTKRTYYRDSKIEREVTYSNGVLNGPFKVYNVEGSIVDDIQFKDGKKNGVFKYYYNEGSMMRVENWSMGIKNGEFKSFYIQGHVQSTENYKKGLKEGVWEEYYADQVMKRKSIYKKDVLIEDHQFNEEGEETYSFGAPVKEGAEDDVLPFGDTGGKKKKKKD